MARQTLQRLSFTAGELSPWLAGRVDLDPAARGASRLMNFYVTPFGGLRRRPGTRLAARAGSSEGVVRLVAFKYSTGVQFMLELGRGYVRYFKDGSLVCDAQGNVLETPSPWKTDAQLRNLRFQQLNDVIYVVEPETPPMKLERHADDDWQLKEMEFSSRPYESALFNSVTLECRLINMVTFNLIQIKTSEDVFTPEMVGREYLRLTRRYGELCVVADTMPLFQFSSLKRDFYVGDSFSMDGGDGWRKTYTCIRAFRKAEDYKEGVEQPERYPLFFESGSDASHHMFVKGAWTLETTGTWDAEWEVCRGYFDCPNYYPNRPKLVWNSVKSFRQKDGFRNNFALSGNEDEFAYYKVRLMSYKSASTPGKPVFKAAACSFDHEFLIDEYLSPSSVHVKVALGRSYYGVSDVDTNDWSFGSFGVRNGYPGTIEFYQGRLWFGGTRGQPQTLWASRVDDFSSFKPGIPADAPMILTMAASQQNRITWLSSLRGLILGTGEGEWRLLASDSAGLNANNASFERHSGVGSASLDALTVENSLLFVQQGGLKIRDLVYSFEADGFVTRDLSLLSDHLLASGIVDWTVQRSTAFHVWCVMRDGSAVCVTLNREQNIVACHVHRLAHGRILSVAALRDASGSQDEEVWFSVARGEGACITIERMAEANPCMDASVTATVSGGCLAGLDVLAGCRVFLLTGAGHCSSACVDELGRIDCPERPDGERLDVGLPVTAEVRTMPLETLETLGRFKKQISARMLLHDSILSFQYGTGDDTAWRDYQPGRYGAVEPYSGYVRLNHNYGTDEQASLALRVETPGPFNPLALVLDVEL